MFWSLNSKAWGLRSDGRGDDRDRCPDASKQPVETEGNLPVVVDEIQASRADTAASVA
jgi:hypothetical protein